MWIVVVVRPSFGTGENGVNDVLQLFFFPGCCVSREKKKIPPPLAVSQRGCQKQSGFQPINPAG